MIRKLAILGAAIVAVVVVLVCGFALFFDADQFRPRLESELSAALGRKVALGHVTLTLLSGGVSVENVTIGDDPAFSSAPFVTAKKLAVGVQLLPLILSRTLRVESFTLDSPRVVLLRRQAGGTWNFSNLSAASGPAPAPRASPAPDISVRKVTIAHGEILVSTLGERVKERVYRDVTVEASDLSFTSEFPFQMSARTPGDGTLDLKGKAGPLNAGAIEQTPVRAEVQVKHFDVAASGVVDPRAGVAGTVEFGGELTSDGRHAHSKGSLRADKVQLVHGGAPARVPLEIGYETEYDLENQSGALLQGDVHVGKALARLAGTYTTRGETPAVKMTLSGKKMPVPDLEASLPAIGVTLPAGSSLQGGTLDIDLSINGAVDRLVIAGPVHVSDTKLRSFDLGGKLAPIAALAGVARSADTTVETLAAALHIAPDGIQVNDLQLVVPSIGSLKGAGTISPNRALSFKMVAQPKSGGMLASVSQLTSFGSSGNGVPFRIQGTTDSPVFVPDVSAVVGNAVKSPKASEAASGLLKKLFKK